MGVIVFLSISTNCGTHGCGQIKHDAQAIHQNLIMTQSHPLMISEPWRWRRQASDFPKGYYSSNISWTSVQGLQPRSNNGFIPYVSWRTLSYYHHHQFGSMNFYLLFGVRPWNNGMRCMFLYILIGLYFVIEVVWILLYSWYILTLHCDDTTTSQTKIQTDLLIRYCCNNWQYCYLCMTKPNRSVVMSYILCRFMTYPYRSCASYHMKDPA